MLFFIYQKPTMNKDKSILSDLGENYEYARTIVNNKIELAKIEAIEESSKLIGKSILGLVALLFGTLFLMFFFAFIAFLIYSVSQSFVLAFGIVCSIIILLMITLIFLKETLIYKPVLRLLFESFIK